MLSVTSTGYISQVPLTSGFWLESVNGKLCLAGEERDCFCLLACFVVFFHHSHPALCCGSGNTSIPQLQLL